MSWGVDHGDPWAWRGLHPGALTDLLATLQIRGEDIKRRSKGKGSPKGNPRAAFAAGLE